MDRSDNAVTAPTLLPVRIAGTGSYVPVKILTNTELEKLVETSDEWITSRTGIRERRIAAKGETTSDLATNAARNALEQANLSPGDVELIIVATITPDTLTPATACYVQEKLGADKAVAFDVSAACSGFLYAMEIAQSFLSTGSRKNALIIGAEKLSAFTNWTDRNTCVLFGDGAGAAVLLPADPVVSLELMVDGPNSLPAEQSSLSTINYQLSTKRSGRILSTHLGTDGRQTELLNIPGGGSCCPITVDNADENLATLTMQGREVFKHAVNAMKKAAEHAIASAGLTAKDIDLVIPHQANLRIIDAIVERLEVSRDKVFINLDKYGNTSAAAVAIALDEANRQGRIKAGDHILLVAFGAGLTWASAAIKW